MRSVTLRTYPWPFRAVLAFSNDCDFLTLEAMLNLHRLFKSPESAGGLDLEFSDSFFFYQNGSSYPHYSYFDGLSGQPTRAAAVVREMLKSGHIDTTHAWGDFEGGAFSRKLAELAYRECRRHGLTVPVWTNHGGYGNWQNIGRSDFITYHQGDDFCSPHYHLDVLSALGVRYFWTDVSLSKTIDLQPCGPIATERDRHAPIWRWVWPLQKRKRDFKLRWSFDRHCVFEAFGTRSAKQLQGFARYDGFIPESDAGLDPATLMTPRGFRAGPNLGRIALTLTDSLLTKLVSGGGCCFLYQHFSTLAHIPARTHITGALEFHPANLEALRRLKSYERRGDIWVAAQAILLNYLYMLNTVEVTLRSATADRATYQLRVKKGYEYRGCAGLTFAVGQDQSKSGARAIDLVTPSGTISCEYVGPDDKGQLWAMVPIKRLPPLDWRAVASLAGVRMDEEIRIKHLSGKSPVDLRMPEEVV